MVRLSLPRDQRKKRRHVTRHWLHLPHPTYKTANGEFKFIETSLWTTFSLILCVWEARCMKKNCKGTVGGTRVVVCQRLMLLVSCVKNAFSAIILRYLSVSYLWLLELQFYCFMYPFWNFGCTFRPSSLWIIVCHCLWRKVIQTFTFTNHVTLKLKKKKKI